MYGFILPNYRGKNIVNLMSSISNSFGKKHEYRELDMFSSKEINKFKNVVLIVVDGLGYNYLSKQKDSFLYKHIRSSMTSTFLSTTACANTTFLVGYPPQRHALTGWDVNLKEIGVITSVLPFTPFYGGDHLENYGFEIDKILDTDPFYEGFKGKCYMMFDKKISDTSFTNYVSQYAKVIPTNNYKNTFTKLKELIKKKSRARRFIHAYFPEFDSLAHREGIGAKEVKDVFFDLDKRIKKLFNSVKGTDTLFIVTSDHGFIDSAPNKEILVDDIPGLKDCLTIPLAGEPRVRDCFVRPAKVKDFERIVKTKMSKYCWCYKGSNLIRDNLYGLGKPNKKLFDRVGDYVLIMKENYILRYKLAKSQKDKEKKEFHKGQHGGVSADEMIIPLIVLS